MTANKFIILCVSLLVVISSIEAFVPRSTSHRLVSKRLPSPSKATCPNPTSKTLLLASSGDDEAEEIGGAGLAVTALGLVACPVVLYSEYVLKTTGCGLPAGPGGSLGALEGISYLVVVGIAGWSIVKKIRTGTGLPAGPAGLLGAVEGLSFLAILVGAVVLGTTIQQYGSVPEAVPLEGGRCSDI
ncbi:hypothetical protein NGA_2002000 [Nannochloropsis gaditana CCMP526]|uniref:Uncharacterized protein n=1 Tax=Nannochloropsis gaditana (strain CCMP526) TaxID=1093141 RepID=I2CQN1_NANGC|nr:hypothetical protein NGA_2002000 [Nannochloropsis gaditana CCMP526]EKU21923.1 hypothetical protein NGA_2002000 [Nannochloropsis gaditana CCMP526]|eukprot:XP_005854433.1 hypothetical protein NGA_2002000 [Nannochloropsis gaditana CCMP526]